MRLFSVVHKHLVRKFKRKFGRNQWKIFIDLNSLFALLVHMMVPKWQDRASTSYICIFTYNLKAATRGDLYRNFTKFTEKHLCQSLFFNKVAGPRPVTLLRKRLWRRYFPFNFTKFLRTPFLTKHLWWVLLKICWHSEAAVCRCSSN